MTKRITFVSLLLAIILILSAVCILCTVAAPQADAAAQTVDVYAINDFHGAVSKMPRVAGFLAARKKEGAVIINSGDMFQGSMESNTNRGKLLTDCMMEAGFDMMTYGNHEFDWGMDNLRTLSADSGVPFVGANIYNWDRNSGWGDFADDFADKYIVKELPNGVKVGVIGVIGSSQITSICSELVQTIGFKAPLPIIKELAQELREEQDCDIVVVSAHAGCQEIVGEKENYKEPSTTAGLEDYVDAMFCAHTHSEQHYLVNGLPFLQGKRYGDFISHVRFSVDNDNVTVKTYENIGYSNLTNVDTTVQNKVQTLIDNSNAAIEEERNEVLTELDGKLISDASLPKLVAHAISDCAQELNYTVDLTIVNEARADLYKGPVTYSQLYEAIPFDNQVYIAKVSGKDIVNEVVNYGQTMWRVSGRAIEDSDRYYYIAIIDYLLSHQNERREYNYFPSALRAADQEWRGYVQLPYDDAGLPAQAGYGHFDPVYPFEYPHRRQAIVLQRGLAHRGL